MPLDRLTLSFVLPLLAAACGPRLPPSGADGESSAGDDLTDADADTDTSEATGTTDAVFVGPADMGEVPPTCEPFEQDCPDGEKCVAYSINGDTWDANKCVPVTGDQAPGEPCTYGGIIAATDDCDETGACWDMKWGGDDQATGTCLSFCTGSPNDPICPESSLCQYSGPIVLCFPTCDPIAQECEDNLACFWTNTAFQCIPTTENLGPGEPCGFINDCAGGLTCTDAETLPNCDGSACCSPFCDLDLDLDDEQCAAVPGTVCGAFFEPNMAPNGYDDIGRCFAP